MNERLRENYFIFIRLALMVVLCLYGLIDEARMTGVSVRILLFVSFYIGLMSIKELKAGKMRVIGAVLAVLIYLVIFYFNRDSFYLLGILTAFEILSLFQGLDIKFYFIPTASIVFDLLTGVITRPLIILLLTIIYIQNNFVIKGYQSRLHEDIEVEQKLKRNMREQEYEAKEEMKRNMLLSENQILEERAALSQTLHDKLGHNINGSVYQLEAAKLLIDKDPEKTKNMLQAVIDQLRTGMDEIRAILRKERPKKEELAMLQLYKLCEDGNKKGVETLLEIEGDTSKIDDSLWEIILDNSFEAVSNSMKYSGCKHIVIKLLVLNKMIRCSITDDGVGCKEFKDGMGISGMRQRVRTVNGALSFETEVGFSVNMILPME